MNPNNNDNEMVSMLPNDLAIKEPHPVNQVTTFSKYLALALFVMLPFLGVWVGYEWAGERAVSVSENKIEFDSTKENTPNVSSEINVTSTTSLSIPKNDYLMSAGTKVFKGYYTKKVIPNNEVLGIVKEGEVFTCDAFVITAGDTSLFSRSEMYDNVLRNRYGDEYISDPETQPQLPLTILIPDRVNWPQMWEDQNLASTSLNSQIYAVVTYYEVDADKDRDTCEPLVDRFIPLTAN